MSKTVQLSAHVYEQLLQQQYPAQRTPKPRSNKRRKSNSKPRDCEKGFIFKCKNLFDNFVQGFVLFLMILAAFWIGETFTPFDSFIYALFQNAWSNLV